MRGQCSPEVPQELGRPGEAREGGGREEEGVTRATGEGEGFQRAAMCGRHRVMASRGVGPGGRGASGPLCRQSWECERAPDDGNMKSRRKKERCREAVRQPVTGRLLLTRTLPARTRRPGGREKGGKDSTTSWTIQHLFPAAPTCLLQCGHHKPEIRI